MALKVAITHTEPHVQKLDDTTPLTEHVIAAIRTVYDPELPLNLYDLGLIYKLNCDDKTGHVHIDMTLTTPNCPVADILPNQVKSAVEKIPAVTQCTVNLVWEPKWSKDNLSDAAKLELGLF